MLPLDSRGAAADNRYAQDGTRTTGDGGVTAERRGEFVRRYGDHGECEGAGCRLLDLRRPPRLMTP